MGYIYVNDKKVNREHYVTKDFKFKEFQSKDGNKNVLLDYNMVYKLQELRDWLNTPIVITSAYRSPQHNKNVGGALNSQHTLGKAIDIKVKGFTPLEIGAYAKALGFNGIGIYDTFTHIDTRSKQAMWGNYKGIEQVKLINRNDNKMTEQEIRNIIRKELKPNLYYTWADKHYDNLNSLGADIKDKNYAHYITRGEVMAMIDKVIESVISHGK